MIKIEQENRESSRSYQRRGKQLAKRLRTGEDHPQQTCSYILLHSLPPCLRSRLLSSTSVSQLALAPRKELKVNIDSPMTDTWACGLLNSTCRIISPLGSPPRIIRGKVFIKNIEIMPSTVILILYFTEVIF